MSDPFADIVSEAAGTADPYAAIVDSAVTPVRPTKGKYAPGGPTLFGRAAAAMRPARTFVENIPSDLATVAKGAVQMVAHPIDTIEGAAALGQGALEAMNPWGRARQGLAPRNAQEAQEQANLKTWNQAAGTPLRNAWEDPTSIPGKVGGWVVEHPVQSVLAAVPVVGAAGRGATAVGLTKTGAALSKAAAILAKAPSPFFLSYAMIALELASTAAKLSAYHLA